MSLEKTLANAVSADDMQRDRMIAHIRTANEVARDWLGEDAIVNDLRPLTASEDFAFMLEKCPGTYLVTGNGESLPLHHPGYTFNDDALAMGASYWVKLVERFLA